MVSYSNAERNSSTVEHRARFRAPHSEQLIKQCQRQGTTNVLPDDVLLGIFACYVDDCKFLLHLEGWRTLIHVCRRWRAVVFASPRRLDLQLLCSSKKPVRKMLDVWPAFPIVIDEFFMFEGRMDNIIAALEHKDRVREIHLAKVPSRLLEELAAMRPAEPFPTLTYLALRSHDKSAPVLPKSFLGAKAPRLRYVDLEGIPFPAVWKLLSSAHNLVSLKLWDIPHSGYISPEVMATCLSEMTSLHTLRLGFYSPRSCPNRARRRLPPLTRVDLPALTFLMFKGVSTYLEDFVSRINAPVLHDIDISFFNQLTFDIPQLPQFIDRRGKFEALGDAYIFLEESQVRVVLYGSKSMRTSGSMRLALGIRCGASDWQPSTLAQICSLPLPYLSTLESLHICHNSQHPRLDWPDDIENTGWLELLQPFASVKELHLSGKIEQCVAPALKELPVERVTGVMPALQSIFIDGPRTLRPVQEAFEQFATVRQLVDHPIAVYHFDYESGDWVTTLSGGP